MYIRDFKTLPDGAKVIEDTYNEIYEVFTKNDKQYLRVVGSQVPSDKIRIGEVRLIDFSPDCIGEQPWIRID